MLEKVTDKFSNPIPLLIVMGVMGFSLFMWFEVLPRESDRINSARDISFVRDVIDTIHIRAEQFRKNEGTWPTGLKDLKQYSNFDDENWIFSVSSSADTFVVKAIVNSRLNGFDKKLWGEYITVDNFEQKYYSHDELRDKYMGAYLKDAKKVESQ